MNITRSSALFVASALHGVAPLMALNYEPDLRIGFRPSAEDITRPLSVSVGNEHLPEVQRLREHNSSSADQTHYRALRTVRASRDGSVAFTAVLGSMMLFGLAAAIAGQCFCSNSSSDGETQSTSQHSGSDDTHSDLSIVNGDHDKREYVHNLPEQIEVVNVSAVENAAVARA